VSGGIEDLNECLKLSRATIVSKLGLHSNSRVSDGAEMRLASGVK